MKYSRPPGQIVLRPCFKNLVVALHETQLVIIVQLTVLVLSPHLLCIIIQVLNFGIKNIILLLYFLYLEYEFLVFNSHVVRGHQNRLPRMGGGDLSRYFMLSLSRPCSCSIIQNKFPVLRYQNIFISIFHPVFTFH